MKVGIYTLGCKVNSYESEFVSSLLKENGYTISSFDDICDIYIINTCTVTNQSDSKSRKIINQAIKRNPDACIIAMGCYIEANKEIELDGVDILIGNKDKSKIISLISKWNKEKQTIRNLHSDLGQDFEDMEITRFEGRTRAFVKIQDGCENYCTYCIIPYVRGNCRSKKEAKVIEEITNLVRNGYQEIVLTGIHTGNYGVDLNTNFSDLLEDILKIDNLHRLRISSIEITELNDEVLHLLENNKSIASHLHIPLQSGSENILKLMNRKYDKKYYREKIKQIRNLRPDISITTDVIVGFPGETDDDFNECYEFCKEIGFTKIHVFPYSLRTGTAAAKFPNQIDGTTKKSRARKLIELSNRLEEDYMKKFISTKQEVLIEQYKDDYSYGHTSNYLLVKIPGKYNSEDKIITEIIDVKYPYCLGKKH